MSTVKLLPKFTTLELEIFNHRLDVEDALAGVLEESFEFNPEAIFNMIGFLHTALDSSFDIEVPQVGSGESILVELIRDCVEGSTFFAGMEDAVALGDLSRGKMMAYIKSSYSLRRKLQEAGIECEPLPLF